MYIFGGILQVEASAEFVVLVMGDVFVPGF